MTFSNYWHPAKKYDEWWYFTLFCDDGCLISGNFKISGKKPTLWVFVNEKGKRGVYFSKTFSFSEFSASKDSFSVRIGDSFFEEKDGLFVLKVDINGLVLDVSFKGVIDWNDNVLEKRMRDGQQVNWIVPCLKGSFDGVLDFKGEKRNIAGSAFHDYVWHNLNVSSMLRFKEWFWGIGYGEDFSCLFVDVRLKGDDFRALCISDQNKVVSSFKDFDDTKSGFFVSDDRLRISHEGSCILDESVGFNEKIDFSGKNLFSKLFLDFWGLSLHYSGGSFGSGKCGNFYFEKLTRR